MVTMPPTLGSIVVAGSMFSVTMMMSSLLPVLIPLVQPLMMLLWLQQLVFAEAAVGPGFSLSASQTSHHGVLDGGSLSGGLFLVSSLVVGKLLIKLIWMIGSISWMSLTCKSSGCNGIHW